MTDGTEFTLQDSRPCSDSRALSCRWTGKTIFTSGSTSKDPVKVSAHAGDLPATLSTARAAHCHALNAATFARGPGTIKCPAHGGSVYAASLYRRARAPLMGSKIEVCRASEKDPHTPMLRVLHWFMTTSGARTHAGSASHRPTLDKTPRLECSQSRSDAGPSSCMSEPRGLSSLKCGLAGD